MYQGHLPDGSSIQRHSAGALYPYVIFGQQGEDGVTWGVLCPNGDEATVGSYDEACDHARALLEARDKSGPAAAALFRELAPLLRTGASTMDELVHLVTRHRDAALGRPMSAKDASRLDVLRGFARLLHTFGKSPVEIEREAAQRPWLS